MKILKYILLTLIALAVLGLIVALFVPKTFENERQIVIDRDQQEVFDYVRFIKNQDHYGTWQLSDPGMAKSYEGTDGTVGFVYHWDSKKMGKGSQTITAVSPPERVETALDFGYGSPARSYIITREIAPGQTQVTWGVKGETPYPWNLMSLFYSMDKDFEQGLQNLKAKLEQ